MASDSEPRKFFCSLLEVPPEVMFGEAKSSSTAISVGLHCNTCKLQ